MAPMVAQPNLPTPLLVQGKPSKQAKAGLPAPRKTGDEAFYARIGQCIDEVRNVFGLSIKEFAAVLGKNESQVRRWVDGSERPQIEAVFAVEKFQGAMVIALARLATGVDVDTVIHVRRSA